MFDNAFQYIYLFGFLLGSVIRGIFTAGYKKQQFGFSRTISLDTLLLLVASIGLLLPLVYLFSPWLDGADYYLPRWTGWTGAVVFAAALWLLWRSHVDLGRHWSPNLEMRTDHTLFTDGVFRYIRHPMYAAHWLWGIAQLLLLHNWIVGPALILSLFFLLLYRIPREEKMLLERFGDEYRAYMSRTKRVIPFIL